MDFKKETIIFLEDGIEKYARVVIQYEGENIYNIVHTYVSERYRGKGIAGKLVAEAVKYIQSMNGKIMSDCSYALNYLRKHDIEIVETGKAPFCSLQHMNEDA